MKKLIYLLMPFLFLNCNAANTTANKSQKDKISLTTAITNNNFKELYKRVDILEKANLLYKEDLAKTNFKLKEVLDVQQQILVEIEKIKNNDSNVGGDNALSYPTEETVQSNIPYPAYSYPSSEPETYLVPFTDVDAGTEIVRISDPSVIGGNGQELGINYSSNAAFNSDATLLKLNKNGAIPAHVLDTSDWSVAYTCSNMPAYANWSFLNPLKIYGMQNGNEWCILDVPTNVRTTQFTFTNYTSVSIGEGEGRQDRNDKYVCLVGTRVGTGNKWLIVYDIQLQSIFAELDLGSAGNLDNATISPLGNYVVVNWAPNGSGAEQGFKVYNRDLTNLRHLWDDSEHSDVGIDVNGDEVLVAFAGASRPDSFSITMVRLVDAVRQGLWFDNSTSPTGGIWGGHISCTNWQRDGWAYITVNDAASNVYRNEVVALKLDYTGDNLIEMFGTAHNNSITPTLGYNHELKGSASPDGTQVALNANWGDPTLVGYNHAPAWVVTFPQN